VWRTLFTMIVLASSAAAADPAQEEMAVTVEGPPEKIVGDLKHAEGPAWDPAGLLLFQDTQRDRTLTWRASGEIGVFQMPSGRANAMAFDREGRLVTAESHGEGGGRRVVRREKDGAVTVLAERFDGKRFNSPNDLTIDRQGRIYFTDPRYSKRETMELAQEAVYRIDPDGKVTRVINALTRPNGIAVSGDARTLLVSDNVGPGDVAKLWAFDLDPEGAPRNGRVVYDFAPGRGIDGMTVDAADRIWAAAGTQSQAGIYVLALNEAKTAAKQVGFFPLPEDPMNCTFGGEKRNQLFVTTSDSVFRLRTNVSGRAGLPGK
jgi:gluconolactonase